MVLRSVRDEDSLQACGGKGVFIFQEETHRNPKPSEQPHRLAYTGEAVCRLKRVTMCRPLQNQIGEVTVIKTSLPHQQIADVRLRKNLASSKRYSSISKQPTRQHRQQKLVAVASAVSRFAHLDLHVLEHPLLQHVYEALAAGLLALLPHQAIQDDRLRPAVAEAEAEAEGGRECAGLAVQ